MVLVHLLECLQRRFNLRLCIGHVHHGIRAESDREAQFVETWANGRQLEFQMTRLNLSAGPGLPDRARIARRRALQGQAIKLGAQWIALAHTATDQAETMLFHLARGAGLEGVAAISAHEQEWIRPILHLSRSDVRELADIFDCSYVDDPTNEDERNSRVMIRKSIMPELRKINPDADRAFVRAAEQAQDAEEALQNWAFEEFIRRSRPNGSWDIQAIESIPKAVRTRLIRRICLESGVDMSQLGYATVAGIDRAILAYSFAATPRANQSAHRIPRSWDLRPNCRFCLSCEGIVIRFCKSSNH